MFQHYVNPEQTTNAATYLHNGVIRRFVRFQEGVREHGVHRIEAAGINIRRIHHTACEKCTIVGQSSVSHRL